MQLTPGLDNCVNYTIQIHNVESNDARGLDGKIFQKNRKQTVLYRIQILLSCVLVLLVCRFINISK